MIKQFWSLDGVPNRHRVNSLTSAISETFGLCVCGYDLADDEISARFTHIRLGQLTLVNFTGKGTTWCERRLSHLRQDYADNFLLYLPTGSRVTISQKNQQHMFGADKIGFINTKYAYKGALTGQDGGAFSSSHIIVPGSLLRSRFPNADLLAGVAVTMDESLTGLMESFVEMISDRNDKASDVAYRGLERVLMEMVSSASECAIDIAGVGHEKSGALNAALERVTTHIIRHLTDPSLSISSIAQDLNISVRHIHNLFEETDWTAKSWIKHRRLLECRKAIHSAELASRTLTEIAYTWGFSDFSHFSRCYKEKFGISPSEDRKSGQYTADPATDGSPVFDMLSRKSATVQ